MTFFPLRSLVWSVVVVSALGVVPSAHADAAAADHANVAAAQQEKRDALARDMANLVMCMLRDNKKSPAERADALQRGFGQVLDIEWIAKFVLGAGWRNATAEQRERYTELYRSYLTKIYVEHYAESSERKISDINVTGIVDAADGNFIARTQVVFTGGDRLRVDYLVRGAPDDNRILDVVVEGVSLLSSHRSEFSAIAASRGVDGVIATLDRKLGGNDAEIKLSFNLQGQQASLTARPVQ